MKGFSKSQRRRIAAQQGLPIDTHTEIDMSATKRQLSPWWDDSCGECHHPRAYHYDIEEELPCECAWMEHRGYVCTCTSFKEI